MSAERERAAKQYRSEGAEAAAKIRADADKQKTIILAQAYEVSQKQRGEGDAESIRIYAGAYGKDPEFFAFTRSLDTYDKSMDKNVDAGAVDRVRFLPLPVRAGAQGRALARARGRLPREDAPPL